MQVGQRGIRHDSTLNRCYSICKNLWWLRMDGRGNSSVAIPYRYTGLLTINDYLLVVKKYIQKKERLLNIRGLELVVFIRSPSVFILGPTFIFGRIDFLLLLPTRGLYLPQIIQWDFLYCCCLCSLSFCSLLYLLILIYSLILPIFSYFSAQQGLNFFFISVLFYSFCRLFWSLMCSISI